MTVTMKIGPGECECSCGQRPAMATSHFRMGHDAKLRQTLTQAQLAGETIEYTNPDGGVENIKPMELALRYGLHEQVQETVQNIQIRRARKAHKAHKVGQAIQITKNGKDYDGVVSSTYPNGDVLVEYRDRSNRVKTHMIRAGE